MLQFFFQIAALQTQKSVRQSVLSLLLKVFLDNLHQVRKLHYRTAYHEIELAFFVLSAQVLCLEILQIDCRSHLVADSDFLARSIYQLELAFREEDGERNARETSAAAEIENLRARTEMDGFGYCQRMEHVVLVQIIDVLAADDIDLAVPVAV